MAQVTPPTLGLARSEPQHLLCLFAAGLRRPQQHLHIAAQLRHRHRRRRAGADAGRAGGHPHPPGQAATQDGLDQRLVHLLGALHQHSVQPE